MARKIKAQGVPVWERDMNPEQLEVIRHEQGPIAVLAQAGSGKTRALVHRIVRLIEHVGVTPTEILAVTFSTKAAGEMNARLKTLGIKTARVGTWHSLCLQILKEDHTEWSTWEVDDKDRAHTKVKEALGFKYLNWTQADFGKVLGFIGFCKANLWTHDAPEALAFAKTIFGFGASRACEAYKISQELIESAGLLTFDDFLVFTHHHLSTDADARQCWAGKFSQVLQDEAQDANRAQWEIARLLAEEHRNYMVVGDVAQSIYGFRGSTPKFLADFAQEWSAKVVQMNRNYRSGSAIVEAANAIIRPAEIRLPEDMIAERDFRGEVRAVPAVNFDAEADNFVTWIRELQAGGASYGNITALFRTNAQSRALEEALLAAKMSYVIVGGNSFYERREVKDLLAYLRVATSEEPGLEDAVRRCINTPFRFLGAAFVQRVRDIAESRAEIADWVETIGEVADQVGVQARQRASAEEWANVIQQIRQMIELPKTLESSRPTNVLVWLIRRVRYLEWLAKDNGAEGIQSSHLANVRELIRVAEKFETVSQLLEYIAENIKAAKAQRQDRQAGGERVLLMSIHRSKGLEWPFLFVCGVNEAILPHAMGNPEEERRLAYVAVTRARDQCVLSYVQEFATSAGIKQAEPSRFLKDAGLLGGEAPTSSAVSRDTAEESESICEGDHHSTM